MFSKMINLQGFVHWIVKNQRLVKLFFSISISLILVYFLQHFGSQSLNGYIYSGVAAVTIVPLGQFIHSEVKLVTKGYFPSKTFMANHHDSWDKGYGLIKPYIIEKVGNNHLIDGDLQTGQYSFLDDHGNTIYVDMVFDSMGISHNGNVSRNNKITLSTFSLSKSIEIIENIVKKLEKEEKKEVDNDINFYYGYDGSFYRTRISRRDASTLCLKKGHFEKMFEHCKSFLDNKELYARKGINFRTGMLLFGPPGTGKSSTCLALASILDMNIIVMNYKAIKDNALKSRTFTKPSILLVEDMDVFFEPSTLQDDSRAKKISDITNFLDGIGGNEGYIVVMTTNHLKDIPDVLKRPGRVDLTMEYTLMDSHQVGSMFYRFFGDCPDYTPEMQESFVQKIPEHVYSAAQFERFLIPFLGNPYHALENVLLLSQQKDEKENTQNESETTKDNKEPNEDTEKKENDGDESSKESSMVEI